MQTCVRNRGKPWRKLRLSLFSFFFRTHSTEIRFILVQGDFQNGLSGIVEARGLDYNNKDDKKEIKKISSVEMQRAREQVGANSSKTKIVFSDREWEAVQKHAISDSLLTKFLNSSDSTEIVKRAMPKATAKLSSAKLSKAKATLSFASMRLLKTGSITCNYMGLLATTRSGLTGI